MAKKTNIWAIMIVFAAWSVLLGLILLIFATYSPEEATKTKSTIDYSEDTSPLQPRSYDKPCNIKGNISFSTGDKIYHMPGQKFYFSTEINTGNGERYFCTEEEAIMAGWRKSKY